jgi:FlaA1/EpsC-like NDP-sugar epimerase
VITTAQSSHLHKPEDTAAQRRVEISTEPRAGTSSVLRNIVRQPWFTSLSLFAADLALVTGAYLLSRAVRVNQALDMSPAYLVQVGVFFACILTAVALIGGYKARRTFQALHFAAEFILAVLVGAALGAFILFVFFSAGDFYTAQSRVVLFYTAIGYALPALGLRLIAASVWTRRARRVPYLAIGTTAELSEFARYCDRMEFHNPVILADLDLSGN